MVQNGFHYGKTKVSAGLHSCLLILGKNSFPYLFLILGATHIPWFMAFFHVQTSEGRVSPSHTESLWRLLHHHVSFFDSWPLFCFPLLLLKTLLITLDSPKQAMIISLYKVSWLVFDYNITFHRFGGLAHGNLWGAIKLPSIAILVLDLQSFNIINFPIVKAYIIWGWAWFIHHILPITTRHSAWNIAFDW